MISSKKKKLRLKSVENSSFSWFSQWKLKCLVKWHFNHTTSINFYARWIRDISFVLISQFFNLEYDWKDFCLNDLKNKVWRKNHLPRYFSWCKLLYIFFLFYEYQHKNINTHFFPAVVLYTAGLLNCSWREVQCFIRYNNVYLVPQLPVRSANKRGNKSFVQVLRH